MSSEDLVHSGDLTAAKGGAAIDLDEPSVVALGRQPFGAVLPIDETSRAAGDGLVGGLP